MRWITISLILLSGCTANKVAEFGAPTRGPAHIETTFNNEGDLTGFSGSVGGGTASTVNVVRKTWYENGAPKSEFNATSDPQLAMAAYFSGVKGQSQQDAANVGTVLQSVTLAVQQLASTAMGVANQMHDMRQMTDQDRADRAAQQQRQDQKFDKLIEFLSKK